MPPKPIKKQTSTGRTKAKTARTRVSTTKPAVSRRTDEGLLLVLTDIVGRVAIQHYANLIAVRDPKLYQDLTAAVEAAGGWGSQELDAATAPEEAF